MLSDRMLPRSLSLSKSPSMEWLFTRLASYCARSFFLGFQGKTRRWRPIGGRAGEEGRGWPCSRAWGGGAS